MLGRTDSRARLLIVLVGFIVIATTLVGRLAYWQVGERDRLSALAQQQTTVTVDQPSHRGTIYDRTGTIVLATTVDRSLLAAAPSQLSPDQRAQEATALIALLGLKGAAATTLTTSMTGNAGYVILQHGIDADLAGKLRDEIASGELQGLSLEPEPVRVYPQAGGGPGTSLAAQLLGFVNSSGVGQYGVEQYYQAQLAGQPTVIDASRNADGTVLPGEGTVEQAGTPGVDLTLTVDAGLQLALEQEVLAAWVADRAKSVSAVVIDPYSGAVYAEASYPSYDANDYQAVAAKNPALFQDPVVSQVYEPGSVFKMMTAIAGFEKGVVKPTTPIDDTGTMRLDGGATMISDADRQAMGVIPFEDIVAYSRNVGAARVALKLGKTTKAASEVLYKEWQTLGFGRKTGIDVAGEVAGLMTNPAQRAWRQIDLANGSFGQGVAVTPIQLAQAYSAMVNGGVMVQPHVVQSIGGQDRGTTVEGQVIPKKLTPTLIKLMNHVVTTVPFYKDRTLVPGYYVGGKTGTAQIWDTKTNNWLHNIFNYSFVGFIGKTAPRLVVAVTIRQGTPTINRPGEIEMPEMSFELFRRIATDAITTLDLPSPVAPKPASTAAPKPSGPTTNPDPTTPVAPDATAPIVNDAVAPSVGPGVSPGATPGVPSAVQPTPVATARGPTRTPVASLPVVDAAVAHR